MHPSRYTRRIMRILAFTFALLLPLAAFAQVPNVDLSGLSDGDKASFMKLVDKFPSACGKAQSLAQSLKSDPKCKRSVFAGALHRQAAQARASAVGGRGALRGPLRPRRLPVQEHRREGLAGARRSGRAHHHRRVLRLSVPALQARAGAARADSRRLPAGQAHTSSTTRSRARIRTRRARRRPPSLPASRESSGSSTTSCFTATRRRKDPPTSSATPRSSSSTSRAGRRTWTRPPTR